MEKTQALQWKANASLHRKCQLEEAKEVRMCMCKYVLLACFGWRAQQAPQVTPVGTCEDLWHWARGQWRAYFHCNAAIISSRNGLGKCQQASARLHLVASASTILQASQMSMTNWRLRVLERSPKCKLLDDCRWKGDAKMRTVTAARRRCRQTVVDLYLPSSHHDATNKLLM